MTEFPPTTSPKLSSSFTFRKLFRRQAQSARNTPKVARAALLKVARERAQPRPIDAFEGPRPSTYDATFRMRIGGDILALNDRYQSNLSHMGRRGARTGMLVGTIAGTIVGIVLASLSLGVGIPLMGVVVGIGGQIVGFFVGLAIERFLQWRFARQHPELVDGMRKDARALRAEILQVASEDPTYEPENDLRNLDLFLHNVEATLGKAALELFSGLFRESPSAVFEVVRDVRRATREGTKHMRPTSWFGGDKADANGVAMERTPKAELKA